MPHKLFQTYYTNPLINHDFPDPSVLWIEGKGYYAYATHDIFSPTLNNILVSHSCDLVHWTDPQGALSQPPGWASDCERFWAPQVVWSGGEYRMYYAADPDTHDGMCLAMAVSKGPFQFRDIGKPVAKQTGSSYAMIDPCLFTDPKTGKQLLYYGSAHQPIRVVETGVDGVSFIGEPVAVIYPEDLPFEELREGAYVTYNRNVDRYFLYVSGNNTWAERSYAVSVFWSVDPVRGFEKIPGDHIILRPNDRWDSPGQNCIITDAIGNEWMVYHAVDTRERYIKGQQMFLRKMCMDRILYTADGWPYIKDLSPSYVQQEGPVVDIPVEIAERFGWKEFKIN